MKYRFFMPAIKSMVVKIGIRVREVPRSGCLRMITRGTMTINIEVIIKLIRKLSSIFELMNFASASIIAIFENSEGCNANEPIAIHLCAP